VNHTPFPSSRRRLRRLAALAGGLVLGATAALTLASPASAHYPTVKGDCKSKTADGWTVAWKVTNSERDITGLVIGVKPAAVGDIKVGAVLPKSGRGHLVGVQELGADVAEATLTVEIKWVRHGRIIKKEETGKAKFKDCKEESPSPSPSPSLPESPSPSPSVPGESPSPSAPAESPSPAPGEGAGGPQLPTTGASLGTAVGVAAGLLAVGGALFFVFRRRRIRFTA
jgi:LPXTG-motif cell wall-anchored protein